MKRILVAFLALQTVAVVAWSQANFTCETPRQAIEGLLYWLQPEHHNRQRATKCFDTRRLDPSQAPVLAQKMIEVLDATGILVDVQSLPTDPTYKNPAGNARYVVSQILSDVYVEKVGDQWLWSAHTLNEIDAIHDATFVFDVSRLLRTLPPWMRRAVFGVAAWQLVGLLLIVLIGVLARVLVALVVGAQVHRIVKRFGVSWAEEVIRRVNRPLGYIVGAGVVGAFLPGLKLPVRLSQVGMLSVRVVAALGAVWAVYRLVDLVSAWLSQRAERTQTQLDDQLVPLVRKALKVLVVAFGAIFVLQNMDVDVAGLLAGLGLGGLAFALAAKDTVANLFGSATIFADRPFHVGDWVSVAGNEGTVEQVGFRSTRVRTFYNSLVSIPNSEVANTVVDNFGAREYRRVKTTVGVTYDTLPEQMQAFVEGIRAIIKANPHTRKDYYEVHFNDFGASSLNILVYFFFKVSSWSDELEQRHHIFLEIMKLARDIGVEFAFPTQTLHLESVAQPVPAKEKKRPKVEELGHIVQAYGPNGARSGQGMQITDGYRAS